MNRSWLSRQCCKSQTRKKRKCDAMGRLEGFEPSTSRTTIWRYYQLSYSRRGGIELIVASRRFPRTSSDTHLAMPAAMSAATGVASAPATPSATTAGRRSAAIAGLGRATICRRRGKGPLRPTLRTAETVPAAAPRVRPLRLGETRLKTVSLARRLAEPLPSRTTRLRTARLDSATPTECGPGRRLLLRKRSSLRRAPRWRHAAEKPLVADFTPGPCSRLQPRSLKRKLFAVVGDPYRARTSEAAAIQPHLPRSDYRAPSLRNPARRRHSRRSPPRRS